MARHSWNRPARALLGAALIAGGCAQRKARPSTTAAPSEPTNAGLAALTRGKDAPVIETPAPDGFDATRQRILESAAQLEAMMAAAQAEPEPLPATPGRSGESAPTDEESTRFSLAAFASDADANTRIDDRPEPAPELEPGPPPPPEPEPAVAADPEQRKRQLLEELVGVLGELALSGEGPGASALALAGLEAVHPDALRALEGQGVLSEAEAASLDAARELFRAMVSEGGIAGPGEVSAVLDRIRRDLDARAGLRIMRAELCTRVNGFGRYETFPANRFVAGRPQPVIVYAEVDRFGHRESTGSDGTPRYEIELSQRLELYHVADNLNTWNRAAEIDKTVSRNLVRDYYLINQVTLPANLTIGRYHLKVVMRDLVSGNAAETIIPIEIVAGTGGRP